MVRDPLVSVIVPVRNGERHVREAIESILAQTRADLEVVVVDDGSTDGTCAIIDSFAVKVRRIEAGTTAGSGAARNLGLEHARGSYVGFLDHDDRWAPDKLERQLDAFAADPEVELVFGHVRQFVSPELDERLAAKLVVAEEPRPARQVGTLLARVETLRRVGPFDTDRQGTDFLGWLLRASELGLRQVMLPETVLWRRLHADNYSRLNRFASSDYLEAIRASLERRRMRSGG